MMKRATRGHQPNGPATTPAGGLALDCPACPHPGKNLPPWWQTVPRDTGYAISWQLMSSPR